MKKKALIIAMLIISVMVAFSSCKKKTVEPINVDPNDTICYYTEPTEDQLKVVTDLETKIYGAAPAAGTYEFSLYNRFNNKVDAYNDSTTKVIVVFNDYVQSLTENDYVNMFKCWRKGGFLVLSSPTKDNYNQQFIIKLSDAAGWYMINEFGWEGLTDEDVNNLTKLIKMFDFYYDDNPSQDLYGCVGFSHNSRYSCYSASYVDSLDVTQNTTPYRHGLLADQCIDWIETTLPVERPSFANLIAGKDGAEDWMYAMTDIKLLPAKFYVNPKQNIVNIAEGIIKDIIKVKVLHDFNDNTDYYQIDQNTTVFNKRVPYNAGNCSSDNQWFQDKNKETTFINYMSCAKFDIQLKTDGKIDILECHPHTQNNNYSSSQSTAGGTTRTVTHGGTAGFSIGISKGIPSATFNAAYQGSVSHGTTLTSVVGHSHSISEISVTQNTNQSGGVEQMEWKYKAKDAYEDMPWHWFLHYKPSLWPKHWVAPLSMSDFVSENSALLRVTDPTGSASVECNVGLQYNSLGMYIKTFTSHDLYPFMFGKTWSTEIDSQHIFNIGTPKRFKEKWSLQCIEYGDIKDDPTMISNFDNFIRNQIFGSESQIFEVATTSATDLTEASLMLNYFMNDFRALRESLVAHKFTGKYTFKIRCENLNKEYTASFTVE